MDIQTQGNLIDRYLHYTTEPFDDWYWDGEELTIMLENNVIEKYTYKDIKEIIEDFD